MCQEGFQPYAKEKQKGIKDDGNASLSSSPSIPGYNHTPSQYVNHYVMIQEPRENGPFKPLLWGQSRECQEGPAGSFGSPLLHCSWRAAGLQADGIS